MAGKLVFVALIALCCAQGLNARTVQHGPLKDAIDDIIDKALSKAREAVQKLVADAKTDLESSVQNIEETIATYISTAESAVEGGKNVVEDLGDRIVAQIEKLLKDAEAKGLDVSKCAEGKVDAAKKAEDEAVEGINECLTVALQTAQVLKKDLDDSLKETEAQLDVVENGTLSCIPENPEHSISEANKIAQCLAEEVVTIKDLAKELVAKLTDHLKGAVLSVEAAGNVATQCIGSDVSGATAKEKALVQEVTTCIQNLS